MNTITVLLVFLPVLISTLNAKHSDEVLDLPGLKDQINFKHYSGYLNVKEGKHLHYWFVESASNKETAPLLLWLNGGPGCSSMEGMLSENGPFKLLSDGETLLYNKYSWNKLANVLYLESPSGVGYSFSGSKNYTFDDDQVSEDNLNALLNFFQLYPEFKNNDFYITGESYAGVYIPTLAVRLLNQPDIRFKGVAIGNGYLDRNILGNSKIFFSYYHGFLDEPSWQQITLNCCNGNVSKDSCNFVNNTDSCREWVMKAMIKFAKSRINPYNIYDTCFMNNSGKRVYDKMSYAYRFLFSYYLKPNANVSIPCVSETSIDHYMNQEEVRRALHISPKAADFTLCNEQVASNYVMLYENQKENVLKIVNAKKRVMIYNGDVDIVCDFLGDQWFIEGLHLEAKSEYLAWFTNNQNSGFYKKFNGLDLVTIRGSGHMVPQDKPMGAYHMMKNFLNNADLNHH